jgi:uncharacterized protein YbjT (DUF2867 family)
MKMSAGSSTTYVILGATGHIGSEVVATLKSPGEKIIAVAHDEEKASSLTSDLVDGVAVDIADPGALRRVLTRGRRAFLLNPPADPSMDTDAEELRTARSIATAVEGSGLEKVVVASTYGAQPGDAVGDLSVLWEFERLVAATGVPMAVNRAAYYFTNLAMLIEPARAGELPTPFPGDLVLPMVSPIDLGTFAAVRLASPIEDTGVQYVEGPERYTFSDVASELTNSLGRPVSLKRIPRNGIEASYREHGFCGAAAHAFERMTLATLDGPELPTAPLRGDVTLKKYLASVV